MWTNSQDTNDDGLPVRLYQPILYSGRVREADPTVSHVGGVPAGGDGKSPSCSSCSQEMFLLLQLNIPEQTYALQVFGCNQGPCVASLFTSHNKFSLGGGGIFCCRRHSQPASTAEALVQEAAHPPSSSWAAGESDSPAEDTNDWDIVADENAGDDETSLEAMVSAMEMDSSGKQKRTTKPKRTKQKVDIESKSFPCYEIHGLQEPPSKCRGFGDDDDDNVGASTTTGSASDSKIEQMLARYMAQEEDPEILAALRGSANDGGGAGAGGKEKEERLPPEDRAMLVFTDRVKRSPHQVVRYAKGGVPLWSIPLPKEPTGQPVAMQIPNCPCGAPREFECQLMPSLLHALDVDKYANTNSTVKNSIEDLMNSGGMNWGVIAIYTCCDSMCDLPENFVVVQGSVDGNPEKRQGATDDAMVMQVDNGDEEDEEETIDNEDDDEDEIECSHD